MTPVPRIALVLLAGHLAALLIAAVRVFSRPVDLTSSVLVGAYGAFVVGASVVVGLRRVLAAGDRKPRTLALAPMHDRPTRELAHWIDPASVEALGEKIRRLGAEREALGQTLQQIAVTLRESPVRASAARGLEFEAVPDDEDACEAEDETAEEMRAPAKPDAMVLLRLEPVHSKERGQEADADRVVFGSRGRLASRAKVMLQKLGNRLRRDTGPRGD